MKISSLIIFATLYCKAVSYQLVQSGSLPTAVGYTAAIFDGQESVFIIGGLGAGSSTSRDVFQYSINSGAVALVDQLLSGRYAGAIGTDGNGRFFLFGGGVGGSSDNPTEYNVQRFTTSHPQLVNYNELPIGMLNHAAVSDFAGSVYLLGWAEGSNEILRYTTRNGSSSVVGHLPRLFQSGGATWVNGSIFAFGGTTINESQRYQTILKFTPETGDTEILDATISGGVSHCSTVTVGTDIYVVGGLNDQQGFSFLRYDTVLDELEELQVGNMEIELRSMGAVYVEGQKRIYTFGGRRGSYSTYYDEIYYIQL